MTSTTSKIFAGKFVCGNIVVDVVPDKIHHIEIGSITVQASIDQENNLELVWIQHFNDDTIPMGQDAIDARWKEIHLRQQDIQGLKQEIIGLQNDVKNRYMDDNLQDTLDEMTSKLRIQGLHEQRLREIRHNPYVMYTSTKKEVYHRALLLDGKLGSVPWLPNLLVT